jgi:hypothetical protein
MLPVDCATVLLILLLGEPISVSAPLLKSETAPALTIFTVEKLFALLVNVTFPVPLSVNAPDPLIAPDKVSALPPEPKVRLLFSVTAPLKILVAVWVRLKV